MFHAALFCVIDHATSYIMFAGLLTEPTIAFSGRLRADCYGQVVVLDLLLDLTDRRKLSE